ncbi:Crp/Fnr family transcriptional regulator [Bradyrhizobium liaoningense]|uniref:Crp/Fnr family transcriptional regulator n=1 Tax=Bradyrhizobium liaoningense TaxID=43992 RepID=UPI001BACD0D9|nr:Crp/Fnr family transcriptional regulator [Bradyrhizobium liaoningense]MBR0716913.1 Crp/Fnr family transcriptional regulator [Bradyrhizobium liaoningense]
MTAGDRPANQLLQMLDAADFALLQPHLSTVAMGRATILGEQDARQKQVYFPHEGTVSMTVSLAGGQSIAVALLGRDSVIGGGAALADGRTPTNATVLFPCTAAVLDIAVFREVADASARFRRLIVRHEQALLAHVQQSLLCNTLHPVEARLTRWLLRARDLCDREALPLTQELLAEMIGVRRNAVSIVAHTLQQAGIIRYSRGQIEIIDAEALAATSCECHDTVKAQYERLLKTGP